MDVSQMAEAVIGGQQQEPVVEQTEQPQQQDTDLAQRLAILSKKEKAIIQRQKALEDELRSMKEKESKFSEYDNLDKLLNDDPIEFFKKKNLSLEQIQEKWMSKLSDEDLDPVQKQLKELKQRLETKEEETKRLIEERLNEEKNKEKEEKLNETKQAYRKKLGEFVEENKEKYELISLVEGSTDEVFELMTQVYMKTAEKGQPKLLTFDEACDMYEKELEKSFEKMRESKKVKKLFGIEITDDPEEAIRQLVGQKTIDDTFAPTSSISATEKSQRERELAAAKLFEQMFN